jgi:hypothetical protein
MLLSETALDFAERASTLVVLLFGNHPPTAQRRKDAG